jgi:ubiquinone/menaquinone biosynthesis C-methylase UbiE
MNNDPIVSSEEQRVLSAYASRDVDPALARYRKRIATAESFAINERRQLLLKLVDRAGRRDALTVLDVGCGPGEDLAWLAVHGFPQNHLFGIDLYQPSITRAASVLPQAHISRGNAAALPFGDRSIDIVTGHVVLMSILVPAVRELVAAEMLRVARRLVISWEPRIVGRDPSHVGLSVAELRRLFGAEAEIQATTLWMPISSRIPAMVRPILSRIPALLSHHLTVIYVSSS